MRTHRAPFTSNSAPYHYGKPMEEHSGLLRLVRAVSVLDGVDAEPTEAGVRTARALGAPAVAWSHVADILGAHDPLDRAPRLRLSVVLVLYRAVTELGPAAASRLRESARPLALPTGHPLHPGPAWASEHVPGDVLDLGTGVIGLGDTREVLPLPPLVAELAGFDARAEWPRVRALGTEWSDVALARLLGPGDIPPVLTGAGGVDALTVISLPEARSRLTGTVAAPVRDKAWLGLGRRSCDESYLRSVWMLASVARRGVLEPLAVAPAGVAPLQPAQRSGSSPIG